MKLLDYLNKQMKAEDIYEQYYMVMIALIEINKDQITLGQVVDHIRNKKKLKEHWPRNGRNPQENIVLFIEDILKFDVLAITGDRSNPKRTNKIIIPSDFQENLIKFEKNKLSKDIEQLGEQIKPLKDRLTLVKSIK